jgi:hypothetical protein
VTASHVTTVAAQIVLTRPGVHPVPMATQQRGITMPNGAHGPVVVTPSPRRIERPRVSMVAAFDVAILASGSAALMLATERHG